MRWSFVLTTLLLAASPALAQSQPRLRPAPPPAESLAAPGRPGRTVDARNGCWFWNSHPQPGETRTWSGPCARGPAQRRGQIERRWMESGQPRMGRFSGNLREGRANGRGTWTGASGNRYEGAFRDDRPDGFGAGPSPDTGQWYRGNWASGCHRGADGTRWSMLRPFAECP